MIKVAPINFFKIELYYLANSISSSLIDSVRSLVC